MIITIIIIIIILIITVIINIHIIYIYIYIYRGPTTPCQTAAQAPALQAPMKRRRVSVSKEALMAEATARPSVMPSATSSLPRRNSCSRAAGTSSVPRQLRSRLLSTAMERATATAVSA